MWAFCWGQSLVDPNLWTVLCPELDGISRYLLVVELGDQRLLLDDVAAQSSCGRGQPNPLLDRANIDPHNVPEYTTEGQYNEKGDTLVQQAVLP